MPSSSSKNYPVEDISDGGTPVVVKERSVIDFPLPTFLKPLFHALVGHLLFEDDDFTQTIRKVLALILLLAGVFQVFATSYLCYKFFTFGFSGDLALACDLFATGTVYIIVYIQFRTQKHCSDGLITAFMATTAVCLTVIHLCSTSFDTRVLDFAVVLLGILLQSPGMPIFAFYHLLLALHGLYTDKYLSVQGAWLPLLPGTRIVTGLEPTVVGVSVTIGSGVAVCILAWFCGQEQKRQVAGAKKSVILANSVVGHLRKYNTDCVIGILEEAKKDKDTNTELLHAFEALVANLEQYRPFLPNYLFLSHSQDDEDEEAEVERASSGTAGVRQEETSGVGLGFRLQGSSADRKSGDRWKSSGDSSNGSQHDSNSNSASGSFHRQSATSTPTTISGGIGHGSHHLGNVACAWVELKCNEWFSLQLSEKTQQGQQQNLRSFTDTVFAVAQSSKASIHSMMGDRVQLSWNATHRVVQPESKGATFLLKLRAALAASMPKSYTLAGACCSGPTEIHTSFSASTKQLALYLDAPWLPVLEGCYTLATKHQTLIIDSATAAGADYEVVAQGVDCLRYKPRVAAQPAAAAAKGGELSTPSTNNQTLAPCCAAANYLAAPFSSQTDYESLVSHLRHFPSSTTTTTGPATLSVSFAFQLLNLKEMAEDEWMYQLNEDAGKDSPATTMTCALQCAVEGRFGEAVVALEQAEEMMENNTTNELSSLQVIADSGGSRTNVKKTSLPSLLGPLGDELILFCHNATLAI